MRIVKKTKSLDIQLGKDVVLTLNGTPIATYPINTIITTVDPVYSPAQEYGGTWERFGQGKVLVGFDENDVDFNEVLKTGGEATHTLTVEEMPSHTHSTPVVSGSYTTMDGSGNTWVPIYNNNNVGYTGGSQAHNNLQPYVVVYRWRRVA